MVEGCQHEAWWHPEVGENDMWSTIPDCLSDLHEESGVLPENEGMLLLSYLRSAKQKVQAFVCCKHGLRLLHSFFKPGPR